MLGHGLAEHIGASALLYAAVAYFVFDDSFFLEDIAENNPELQEELHWWCEDIYSSFYTIFDNLRTFYETTDKSAGPTPSWYRLAPFRLLKVVYWHPDEDVYIQASRDESDDKHGSQWRVLAELDASPRGHRPKPRTTVRIPLRRSWTAPHNF